MTRYLADTSIWAWAQTGQRPDIREKLSRRLGDDRIATCVPVALEALHRADTSQKYEAQFSSVFEPLEWLPLTERASLRALEVQRGLAGRSHGAHRRSVADFLIAAVAETSDVVLWCFDDDFRVIAELTGQPLEAEASTGPGH